MMLRSLFVFLLPLVALPCSLRAEQTGQQLVFPSHRLNLLINVQLGSGWEEFRVLHPSGAGFVIPTQLMVHRGSAKALYDGGISFFVDASGTV